VVFAASGIIVRRSSKIRPHCKHDSIGKALLLRDIEYVSA
jgi:hypothetical protein